MSENPIRPNQNKLARAAALGLSSVALFGFSETAQASSRAEPAGFGPKIENTASSLEAEDPYQVAAQVLDIMNSSDPELSFNKNPHPNAVWGGVILIEPGTFINNAPIAAAESSKTRVEGTWRVPKGQAYMVELGRLYRDDKTGHNWVLGYINTGFVDINMASDTQNTKWIDLKTAKYKSYAYPSDIHKGRLLEPKLLPVRLNDSGNLMLDRVPFNTIKGDYPPILQIMTHFEKTAYIQPQLDYYGLRPTKVKPHF